MLLLFFFGFFHVCDFVRAWNIAWGPWGAPTTTETTTTTRWNEPLRSTFFFFSSSFWKIIILRIGHGRFSCSFYPVPFGSFVTQKKTAAKPFRVIYNTRRNGVLRAIDLRLWSTSCAFYLCIFLFEIFPGKTPTKWRPRIWDGVWRRQGGRRRRRQDPG